MIKEKSRISRIPEKPRYQKEIHVYTDIFGNIAHKTPTSPIIDYTKKPMFPDLIKACGIKEVTNSSLKKWLNKHKDSMKILKNQDNIILLFQNREQMDKYLADIVFDKTIGLKKEDYMLRQQPRAFVHPSKRLTPQEIEALENMGFIPVQSELGETTRLVTVRVDTRNLNKLRVIQKRLEAKGKKLTLTKVFRLALLKGIEQLMKETSEN